MMTVLGERKSYHRGTGRQPVSVLVTLFILLLAAPAAMAADGYEQEYQQAVQWARGGQHARAIAALEGLLKRYPEAYDVRRDLVIIHAWAGDCASSLRAFRPIHNRRNKEDYLVTEVADCMINDGQYYQAISLLTPALNQYPGDRALARRYQKARKALDARRQWQVSAGGNVMTNSIGTTEARIDADLRRLFGDRTVVYGRRLWYADTGTLSSGGRFDRVGIGMEHTFANGVFLREDLSTDVTNTGLTGLLSHAEFKPFARSNLYGEFTNYAEDIDLLAVSSNVSANRATVGMGLHTDRYVWEGDVSYNQYQFSDTNRRQRLALYLGYALDVTQDRERRIGLETGHETNTLTGAAYFNPLASSYLNVFYKMEFPYKSRFKRHVDSMVISAGAVDQQGFGAAPVASFRYIQDYTFDQDSRLGLEFSLGSAVYDGVRETDLAVAFRYSRGF